MVLLGRPTTLFFESSDTMLDENTFPTCRPKSPFPNGLGLAQRRTIVEGLPHFDEAPKSAHTLRANVPRSRAVHKGHVDEARTRAW